MHTLAKELVNSIAQNRSLVRQSRWSIEIDHKRKRRIARQVLGPAYNELFSFRIKVFVPERRRINGIEQLFSSATCTSMTAHFGGSGSPAESLPSDR
jgi:hypothetical protein